MRLLLDENISYRVLKIIESSFPSSVQITQLGFSSMNDGEVFRYAKERDFLIVTFDEDFYELQLMNGFPPKIIWLRFGNSNNLKVANKLVSNLESITNFFSNEEKGLLEIF